MIDHRSSRTLCLAFAAAAALLSGGPGSAQRPSRSAPRSAPALPRSDSRGPLIQVRGASGGQCAYFWDGRATAQADLLEPAVEFIESLVRRLGGVENVTAANFPDANLQFADDVPYRCVRTAFETVAAAGFMQVRVADPNPDSKPWTAPMAFELRPAAYEASPPPVDPVYNRLGLSARGVATWNDKEIGLIELRQYSDITQTMNPVPQLRLEFGDRTPYREVGTILGIIWRARADKIKMSNDLGLSATSITR